MLKIGVQLPARFEDSGEFLADARALDSAGADSLWLDGDPEAAWLALAAISAVTGRTRLVAPVIASDASAAGALAARLAALERLSRGRVVLGVAAPALIDLARRCGPSPVIVQSPGGDTVEVATLADGLVDATHSPEACRSNFERALQARRRSRPDAPFECWARIDVPGDRAHWREMLAGYEAAGATGVIVPADARLLDLLRNADEDDDRSDLVLAQG